jgi:hypothetical protein
MFHSFAIPGRARAASPAFLDSQESAMIGALAKAVFGSAN